MSARIPAQMSDGGCLCAAIRYRVRGSPLSSFICHCATCRRASAAPSVAWLTFDRAQFEFLSGRPLAYQSSPGVVRRFCGTCGSAISYENAQSPATIDVTTITLDDAALFPPTRELWFDQRVPWQAAHQGLRQYPRSDGGVP